MSYDDKCFIRPGSAWRREFISRWRKVRGARAVMAVNQHGDVVGYGCRNPDVNNAQVHKIGPLYADSYNIAYDLVHDLARDVVQQTVTICIQ